MKTLLGTAVVVAGMTFGVSHAFAHPAIGCGCDIVSRVGVVSTYSGKNVEHIEKTYTESGKVNANCKVDLGPGAQVSFDTNSPLTKGFFCNIDGVQTLDWHEVISANGQTTLTCQIK
jgi:hypothetical protein